MFSLFQSINHYVPTNTDGNADFGNLLLEENTERYGSIFNFQMFAPEDNAIPVAVERDRIIEITTEKIVYEVEENVEQPIEIVIEDKIYTLTNVATPQPGEFSFDTETRQVVVSLVAPTKSTNPVIINYVDWGTNTILSKEGNIVYNNWGLGGSSEEDSYIDGQGNAITQRLTKNHLCGQLSASSLSILNSFNADGTITLSRRFQQHASLVFTFNVCGDRKTEVLSRLANGTEFTAFDIRWVVMSLSIAQTSFSNNLIVSVSCSDWLASRGTPSKSPLDMRVKKKIGSKNSHVANRSLREISKVQTKGKDISFRVPRRTSYEETISARELLGRAVTVTAFPFYTNGEGLEIRDWKQTRTHTVSDREVRSNNVSFNYQGHGSELAGVKLHTEYRNLKVDLSFDEDAGNNNAGTTVRYVFDGCQSRKDLVNDTYYSNGTFRPPERDTLRSMSVNFDSGGRTKKETKITEVNGTITFEVIDEYGYAFTSNEVYRVQQTGTGDNKIKTMYFDPGLSTHLIWKQVSRKINNYIYDEEGYLTSIRTTGWRLSRLKQETESLEVINLEGEILYDDLESLEIYNKRQEQNSYGFDFRIPIREYTFYSLDKHADYFEGTVKPGDACNDFWVEPRFVKRMDRVGFNKRVAEDPRNEREGNDRVFPPIVTGDFLQETELTTITNTNFPFKFEKRSLSRTARGSFFRNAFSLGNVSTNNGKPGLQSRLIRTKDKKTGSGRENYLRYRFQRYFLDSPGVTSGITTIEGSKGYPDVDDPNIVKIGAQTELSITNSQNSCTTRIDIDYRSGIEEGDFVIWRGKRWKVFGITDTFKIDNNKPISQSKILDLGLYLTPALGLENRTSCLGGEGSRPSTNVLTAPQSLTEEAIAYQLVT